MELIVAVGKNGYIGKDNDLLFRIPNDLRFFNKMTMGKNMIMGRKTYESIGRPLPGRTTYVLSRSHKMISVHEESKLYKVPSNFNFGGLLGESIICGGGEIYKLFIDEVDTMYITQVDEVVEGDVKFPHFDKDDWNYELLDEFKGKHSYKIIKYTRKNETV